MATFEESDYKKTKTLKSDLAIEKLHLSSIQSVSINIDCLLDECDELAKKIQLTFNNRGAFYLDEVLKKEVNKINYQLKQKLNLPSMHFLYKGLIELESCGEGGYGQVFKVYDPETNMVFAKKIRKPSEKQSFSTYAIAEIIPIYFLEKINNLSLVSIYHINFIQNVKLDVIMEYGIGTLADLLKYAEEIGYIYESFIPDLLAELNTQLEILHNNNICHCDIKPQNIIIYKDKFKFSDYGLAKKFKSKGKRKLTPFGTEEYMSEEMRRAYRSLADDAFVCPYEEDEYRLNKVLKEAMSKTQKLLKYKSKYKFMYELELYLSTMTFKNITDVSKKRIILKSLEKICWNPNFVVDFEDDQLNMVYETLIREKQGQAAYGKNNSLAFWAYEDIYSMIKKSKISEYRGSALIRAAEIARKAGNYDKCLQMIELQEKFKNIVIDEPHIEVKISYMKNMINFYREDFDDFITYLEIKNLDELFIILEQKIVFESGFDFNRLTLESEHDFKILKDKKTIESILLEFDLNFIIFSYLMKHKKLLRHYATQKSVQKFISKLYKYYQEYILNAKDHTSNFQMAETIYNLAKIMKSLDPKYHFINQTALLKIFEDSKALFTENQGLYKKNILLCDLQISQVLIDLSDTDYSMKYAFELLLSCYENREILNEFEHENEPVDILLGLIKSAEHELKIIYYEKLFDYMIENKFSASNLFYEEILSFVEYYKRKKEFKILLEFKEKYLHEIDHPSWPKYKKLQLALALQLRFAHKKQIEEIFEWEPSDKPEENLFYPTEDISDLIEIYNQIKTRFGEDTFDFILRIQPSYLIDEEIDRKKYENKYFFCLCIACFSYVAKKDINIISKKFYEYLKFMDKITMDRYDFVFYKITDVTSDPKIIRNFEYFCRLVFHPRIDFKELFEGLHKLSLNSYAQSCKYFCSYYRTSFKKIRTIDPTEVVILIEKMGQCLHNLHILKQNKTEIYLEGKSVLQEIFNEDIEDEDWQLSTYIKSSVKFYLFDFVETEKMLREYIENTEKLKEATMIDAILEFRWSYLLLLRGNKTEALEYYSRFSIAKKSVLANSKHSFYFWHLDHLVIDQLEEIQRLPTKNSIIPTVKARKDKKERNMIIYIKNELTKFFLGLQSANKEQNIAPKQFEKIKSNKRFFEYAIRYLKKHLGFEDYRLLELYYLNSFSKLNLFDKACTKSMNECIEEFREDFPRIIEIHKKYSGETHKKGLDEFAYWVFLMIEQEKIIKIKELLLNYTKTLETWAKSPLVIVSLLDELQCMSLEGSLISLQDFIKSESMKDSNLSPKTPTRLLEIFKDYNLSSDLQNLNIEIDRVKREINTLVIDHDDYDPEITDKYRHLCLIETNINDKLEHIQFVSKILEWNAKEISLDYVMPHIIFLVAHYKSENRNAKLLNEYVVLFKDLALKQKNYFKSKMTDVMFHFEPYKFTNGKIDFKIFTKDIQLAINLLQNSSIYDCFQDDIEEYKAYDYLYNKPPILDHNSEFAILGNTLQSNQNLIIQSKEENDNRSEYNFSLNLTYNSSNYSLDRLEEIKEIFGASVQMKKLMCSFIFTELKNYSVAILNLIGFLKDYKEYRHYDREVYVAVCLQISSLSMKLGFHHIAILALRSSLKEIELYRMTDSKKLKKKFHDTNFLIVLKVRLAILYFEIGKHEVAYNMAEKGKLVLEAKPENLTMKAKYHYYLGSHFLSQNLVNEAKLHFEEAIKIRDLNTNEQTQTESSTLIIFAYMHLNQKEEACQYINYLLKYEVKERRFLRILLLCLKTELGEKIKGEIKPSTLEKRNDSEPICRVEQVLSELFCWKIIKKFGNYNEEKKFRETFIQALESFFCVRRQFEGVEIFKEIPVRNLDRLRGLRLEEIISYLEKLEVTSQGFINAHKFLMIEWHKWNINLNISNSGFHTCIFKGHSNECYQAPVYIKDLTKLDDISNYFDYVRENSEIITDVYVGDYITVHPERVQIGPKTYFYYLKQNKPSDSNEEAYFIGRCADQNTEVDIKCFDMPYSPSVKTTFCDILSTVKFSESPHFLPLLDFKLENQKLFIISERINETLEIFVYKRKRYVKIAPFSERTVLKYLKQIIDTMITFDWMKLRYPELNEIIIKNDKIQLDVCNLLMNRPSELSEINEKNMSAIRNLGRAFLDILSANESETALTPGLKNLLNGMVEANKNELNWKKIAEHPLWKEVSFEPVYNIVKVQKSVELEDEKKKQCSIF